MSSARLECSRTGADLSADLNTQLEKMLCLPPAETDGLLIGLCWQFLSTPLCSYPCYKEETLRKALSTFPLVGLSAAKMLAITP